MGYIVLVASFLMQVCLGGIYAWSVFVPFLRESYGMSTAQTQVIFGLTIAMFTISMVFSGKLLRRMGPRKIAFLGALMLGGGYILASYSMGSFFLLLIAIGILVGSGIGFGYVCPLSTCVKWFPQHKGLVTGVSVAGFGGGAVLLSGFANYLFGQGMEVLEVFRTVGICYGSIALVCSLMLSVPRDTCVSREQEMVSVRELIVQPRFLSLAIGMFTGTFAGLLIIGNIRPMGLAGGLEDKWAVLAISLFAIGNATGRLTWGALVDRLGKIVVPLSLFYLGAIILLLIPSFASGLLFALAITCIGFGFGSFSVLYATLTVERFGADAIGSVYPLIFLAYGLSGVISPGIGGLLYDVTGTYKLAIVIASFVSFVGFYSTFSLEREKKHLHIPVSQEAPEMSGAAGGQ
jgi:MFS transporter, OFA family, oxalate/formate antiporter